MVALRAASKGLKEDLNGMAIPSLDGSKMQTSLLMLKSKIQSLRIADIADVNVQPGLIMTQLNLLKRLIQQAGIDDILDIDVSQGKLTDALSNIASMSETIPVDFAVSKLPDLPREGITVPVRYQVLGGPHLSEGGESIPVKFKPDTTAVNAEIAMLAHTAEVIPVKFDVEAIPQIVTGMLPKPASLPAGPEGISAATLASWAALSADTYKLSAGLGNVQPLIASFGNAWATAGAYAQMAGDRINQGVNTSLVVAAIMASRARTSVGSLGTGLLALGMATTAGIKGMSGLTTTGGGFGAKMLYTIPILGTVIHSVAAFHVALDSIAEAMIAFGLGALAATPAVLVLSNLGVDFDTHFAAVHDTTEALGQAIPPLTGKFDALARSMAPQGIELFGGAMQLMVGRVGLFDKATQQVVTLFDDWIAKIDIFASGQGLNKFLASGEGYLKQFGSIVGNVGEALGGLLTKDPGIAHFLLDIIGGLADLLRMFTSLPGPIVEAVLALHGVYVWASVITPLLLAAAGGIFKMVIAFGELFANPLTWFVLAAASVAYLASQFGEASVATGKYINNINNSLSNDTATGAILGISGAIGDLTSQISETGSSSGIDKIQHSWANLGNTATSFDSDLEASGHSWESFYDSLGTAITTWPALEHTITSFGDAIKDVFVPGAGAAIVAKNNIKAFDDEITKLISQQGTLFRVAGALTGQNMTLAQSFAIEDLAGVKASDSFTLATQKVNNLLLGYRDMSVQGGILSNTVNAVSFATLQQQSDISQLTGGWDAFFKMITSGQSGLVGFLQQTSGLYQALGSGSAKLTVSNGHASISFKSLASGAASGAASLTGVNTASLNAQESFLSAAQAAQAEADNIMTMASAAGLGSKGTDLVTSSVKDMVTELLPAAKNSSTFTTVLYALAQQGGYQGADSFKALSGWVTTASGSIAKAKDPTKQLNGNIGTLTKSAGNLTTDVQNLSIALGTDLTQAESAAILLARGGTAPFDAFAKAIADTGVSSKRTKDSAFVLGDELLSMANNNVPAAEKEFESFAIGGLHLTQQHADALWQDIINHGLPALADAGSAADSLKNNHLAPLGAGVDTVAGKVRNLSDYLLAVPKNISSTVRVNFVGSGTGSIAFKESIPGVTTGPSSTGLLGFHAEGGKITGGTPGKDSVLGVLMPGEVVVPTRMVQAGAVDHLRGRLPGFASGGVVTSSGMGGLTNMMASGQPFMQNTEEAFGKAVESAFAAAAIAKFKKDAAAAMDGGGGNIVSYAESFLGKLPYVWGGTSLTSGADCSGFVQSVYSHFGIHAPRTSEAQGSWVKQGTPVPGGLAFYISAAGGPPPGHVAIVANSSSVVSQGGGMGPQMMGLHDMPLMFTGTPPGGFPGGGGSGGGATAGTMSSAQIEALWDSQGGPASAAGNMARIAMAESGDRPSAIQPDQPADLTGWGLYQITPTSGINQNGAFGNLLNASNNTRAAISLFRGSGYQPWDADPVGASLTASGLSYAAGGLVGNLAHTQGLEKTDYAHLVSAFGSDLKNPKAGSYASQHKEALTDELRDIAEHQATELKDYGKLSGTGISTSYHLSDFLQEAMEERSKLQQYVKLSAKGGHPALVSGLEWQLNELNALGKGSVTSTGLAKGQASAKAVKSAATEAQVAALRASLQHTQKLESEDYAHVVSGFRASLAKPKKGSYDAVNLKSMKSELATLAGLQDTEVKGFNSLSGTGLTTGRSLGNFLADATKEANALSKDKNLSHVPGGHPALVSGLMWQLAQLGRLGSKDVSDKGLYIGPGTGDTGASSTKPTAIAFPAGYGSTEVFLDNLMKTSIGYDNGGWLKPGLTLAYNGTGSPERVGSPSGSSQAICLEIVSSGSSDFDAFMLKWMKEKVRIKGGGNVQKAFGRH